MEDEIKYRSVYWQTFMAEVILHNPLSEDACGREIINILVEEENQSLRTYVPIFTDLDSSFVRSALRLCLQYCSCCFPIVSEASIKWIQVTSFQLRLGNEFLSSRLWSPCSLREADHLPPYKILHDLRIRYRHKF